MTSATDDCRLAALNESERELLRLLAKGHTAKTAALATGQSVGAVNERLRAARRKTDAGSSRELARWFADQENRAEKIGIASSTMPPSASANRARPSAQRSFLWRPTMLIVTAALAAALAYGTAPSVDTDGESRQTTDFPFEPAPDLPALHAQVLSEVRDDPWASEAESTLQRLYDGLDGRTAAQKLEVTCAATLCEVLGEMRMDVADDERAVLIAALQDPPVMGTIAEIDLTRISNAFGGAGEPPRMVFVAHWKRSGEP